LDQQRAALRVTFKAQVVGKEVSMLRKTRTVLGSALAVSFLLSGYLATAVAAVGDDNPPPPAAAPGNDGPKDRHHNPAWAACKKQADDQKLAPGDARHDFMKNCMKSAKEGTPPPAS
jgi:hypothetical protein